MSSHPPADRARAWRLAALGLVLALLLVLAAGAWSLWRPLSDDDAARLAARAATGSVRTQLHPNPWLLPEDALTRQLDAFGPPATPAQQRRLEERGAVAPAPPSLEAAADDLARLARSTEDEHLTADLAAVAASWWAGAASGRGADALSSQDDARETEQETEGTGGAVTDREDACGSGLTTAVTAVDRSLFTAETAAARTGPEAGTAGGLVDGAAELHRAALSDPRVAPVLECEPPPVAGHHELPPGVQEDPVRALGRAEQEARDTLVRAAASSSGEQRAWILEALRTAARAGQVLDPEQPVPALPGRP
ncbi:hypothetical protein [Kocuria tytonicola]|uniref:hypothetical protein n=1 Tax=Kocuria tytonicola TaxID=2055946 RepID=UPI000F520E15|nr:hypothetical protein [Kocuria tytonicola]